MLPLGGRFRFFSPLLGGAGAVAIVEGAGGGGQVECAAVDDRDAWLADDSMFVACLGLSPAVGTGPILPCLGGSIFAVEIDLN